MNNGKLKAMAKERLTGNYPILILCLLLFILLGGCCSFIGETINAPWISELLTFFVYALIAMGFVEMILKVARNKKVIFEDLFEGINLFGKYVLLSIILSAIGLLMYLMEYLAFKSLLIVLSYQASINEILAVVLVVFGLFLSVAIIMVDIYIAIALSQSYFILADEPKKKVTSVLIKSFDITANYVLEYFVLVISFLGWIILGIFTLGILYFWLIPYMYVTLALFYDKIKKNYEETTGDYAELENAETPVQVEAKPVKKVTKKAATKTNAKKTTTAKKTVSKTTTKTAPKKTTVKKTTSTKRKMMKR